MSIKSLTVLVFSTLQLNLTEIELQKSDSNLATFLNEVKKNLKAKVNHMVVFSYKKSKDHMKGENYNSNFVYLNYICNFFFF